MEGNAVLTTVDLPLVRVAHQQQRRNYEKQFSVVHGGGVQGIMGMHYFKS